MKAAATATVVGLAAVVFASANARAVALPPPLRAPITIDGNLADWNEVLANPRNTTRDGQGAALGSCVGATDADCPFTNLFEDLDTFAWTWSDTHVYLHVRRFQQGIGTRFIYFYIDADNDGRVETGEPLIGLSWTFGTSVNTLWVESYSAQGFMGDPLANASGQADGYDLPGNATGGFRTISTNVGVVPGRPAWEGAVPWSDLGLAPGAPFGFHVMLSVNQNLPVGRRDNLGGFDDGPGSTAWRGVGVTPPRTASVAPSGTVRLAHAVTNTGNLAARVALSAVSSTGWDLNFYRDFDGDGLGNLFLGTDAAGDGVFSLPGDVLAPLGDTDLDGLLDLGVLADGETAQVVIIPVVPVDASGLTGTITLTAWQPADPDVRAALIDTVRVGDVTLRPDGILLAAEGDAAWFAHVVQNNLPDSVVADLEVLSAWGWPYALFADPNGDGQHGDAVALVDSDGSGFPDVRLSSGQQASIFLRGPVPVGTPEGRAEVAIARVIVAGIPLSSVTDSTTVAPRLALAPPYLQSAGQARYGGAGGSVYFAHRLTHAGGTPDVCDILATSDLGWAVTLLSDPDGDGRPFDSELLAWNSGLVAANGGVFPFILRVDIPPGAAVGQVSRISVSATSRTAPVVSVAVDDDAVAALVRVYEDAGHVLNAATIAPCATAYAAATNLPPSASTFRFHWRDGAGTTVRLMPVTTDVTGACQDQITFGVGQAGPAYSVAIEQFAAGTWSAADTAPFDVGDAVALAGISPAVPVLHFSGRTLRASATLVNGDPGQSVSGISLRWVVRTDDSSAYLTPAGVFAPYTGTEATRTDLVSVLPGQSLGLNLNVPSVSFPGEGEYTIEIWRAVGCAGETLHGLATFQVVDDADNDGLTRGQELAAGIDPNDADSDDDGLTDGLDGLGDSDGDGFIDALDCDSDDDGLPDGQEAGVWSPGPGTNVAAGCFVPDLWPSSTTDPDDPDTDGGGVPDGLEDRDHDGKVDAGEGDPNAPADDAALDADRDGLTDLVELARGLSPFDQDSDDDGVIDSAEADADSDGDGLVDGLDCDSDNDGLVDGLESGLILPLADTDEAAGCFVADADPLTQTDPTRADTDGGGMPDGNEDSDRNGRVDLDEGDPNGPADDASIDPDGDGLPSSLELRRGLDPNDADSDDDGIADGAEPEGDADGDGLDNAADCDSDGDTLPDGLEAGVTTPLPATLLAAGCFVADADPLTTTNPLVADTDGGGVPDGLEDFDRNGRIDAGEGDPDDPADDSLTCSPAAPAEVTGVTVRRQGAAVRVAWVAAGDRCTTWQVLAGGSAPPTLVVVADLSAGDHVDSVPVGPEGVRYYLVQAVSLLGGPGAIGR